MWQYLTYFVAENPWPLVVVFGLIAAGFLAALRVTGDARYLRAALIALGLAATVLIVEHLWVTEAERIEAAVYDLADAVRRSDATAALALMDDHVAFGIQNTSFSDELDLSLLRVVLNDVKFDWLHLSRLTTNAGKQTHMGQAAFKVNAAGTYLGTHNFLGLSEWSLGFRRAADGSWKITRITATRLPPYAMLPPQLGRRAPAAAPPQGPLIRSPLENQGKSARPASQ